MWSGRNTDKYFQGFVETKWFATIIRKQILNKKLTREPQVQNLSTWISLENLYYFKNVLVQVMFTLTVFKILLFECRSVLSLAQRGTRSES